MRSTLVCFDRMRQLENVTKCSTAYILDEQLLVRRILQFGSSNHSKEHHSHPIEELS